MQTICSISKNRPKRYALQDDIASSRVDILMVDQDNPDAMIAWKRFQAKNQMIPTIMLTRQPGSDPSVYQLGRPLMATRLLSLLDQMPRTQESPAFVAKQQVTAKVPRNERVPQSPYRSAVEKARRENETVALVVDDSLPVRQQIANHLAPHVTHVELAVDGEQAIKLLAVHTYDIIFLDVVLPGMDGYKICKEIKRDKRTKQTPVIMLTGKSSPFDMVKGKLAGCDTYLTKPVDSTTFNEVVQKYLKKSGSSESDDEPIKLVNGVPGNR
jgi:twitching motility two-component system response regulator PilG